MVLPGTYSIIARGLDDIVTISCNRVTSIPLSVVSSVQGSDSVKGERRIVIGDYWLLAARDLSYAFGITRRFLFLNVGARG